LLNLFFSYYLLYEIFFALIIYLINIILHTALIKRELKLLHLSRLTFDFFIIDFVISNQSSFDTNQTNNRRGIETRESDSDRGICRFFFAIVFFLSLVRYECSLLHGSAFAEGETTRVMKPDRETTNCVMQYYGRVFD